MNPTLQQAASAEETAEKIQQLANQIVGEIETVIVGKRETARLALAAVLGGGHILIEDIPGVGKTSLAKTLARTLGCSFKRIQFTPDLLPSDITGSSVYNQKTSEFEFRPGPVFANVVLADEINRGSPKTQSSLLECMEEAQVTADGITHLIASPFFVIATQNHIEFQGTYPLPEAQLDRFMMRLSLGYPQAADESRIIETRLGENPMSTIEPIIDSNTLMELQQNLRSIYVDQSIRDWVVEIASKTRNRPELFLGLSPRGTLNLIFASRAVAAISGRPYVSPDDVKAVSIPVMAHRLVLKPEMRMRGADTTQIVQETLDSIATPLSYAKR